MSIKKIEKIFLDGRVKWATVHKPRANTQNSTNQLEYSVTVECSEEQLNKLKAKGVSVKTKLRLDKDDGRTYINIMNKAKRQDGTDIVISVVGADGNPMTDLIGNGSKARVVANIITSDSGTVVLRLQGLQVTELVEYVPKQVDMFEVADGEII